MTLMKAKKPLALLLALLAALSLLGTTALAAGLPEETIAAQTELCGEDCGHTHEEVFSHTEHTEESLPEPEEIAVPVATPLLEQPEPEAGQPSDTSGVIPGSGIYWELNEYGWLMLSGNGSCPTFVSPDDQPWAAVREQITQVWFEDMDALSIPSLAYWFTGCTALTMAEIPYTTPVIGAAAFAGCPSLRQIQLYYSGTFTIVPGAFSTGSLTPLLVLFIPEYDSVLGTLAAYDWTEDRRAAYFEDVYGITLLATGYCSNCKRTCSYTVEYEQWTNSEHCVRHWCSNCGYDQAGGVNGEAHSFRSGVCSKCGYSLCSCGTVYKGEREKYWYLSCTHQRQDIADPCSGVRVRYADLLEIVRQDLNTILSLTDEQVDAMVQEALKQFGNEDSIKARKLQKEQAEARLLTIDKVVTKLYTDNAEGRLDDERLQRMVEDLEKESAGLRSLLSELELSNSAQETKDNYAHFFALARQYTHIEKLDREVLQTFVEKIEVGPKELPEGMEKATHRNQPYRQSIRIFYRFIGEMKGETKRDLPLGVSYNKNGVVSILNTDESVEIEQNPA